MLNKSDLSQIKNIVREEVEAEGENIRSEINGEIKLAGIRTTTELQEVNTRLKNLEIAIRKIQKDLTKIIEEHLGIPEPVIV